MLPLFFFLFAANYIFMEDLKTKTETLADHVSDYIETYVKLAVVNATQKATSVASVSLMAVLITFFFMFVLIFAGIGASLWLGEMLENMKAGYFIVGGFYLVVAGLLLLFRKSLVFPFVRNQIIRKVYE